MVKAVILCPGQGVQKVGMGRDVAEAFPAAREIFAHGDHGTGFALSTLMWEGPESDLTRTDNAQAAIFTHTLAVWNVVKGHITPVAAAGHSLGEYSAHAALGTLNDEDAVRLVRRRGELMREAGEARPGAMAAVLGLDAETVSRVCAAHSGDGREVVAANLNAPDQVVISGDPQAVERVGDQLKAEGAKRVLPLKVSGAFHSPLMAGARVGLEAALAAVTFHDPAVPVVANASAEPVTSGDDARRLLGEQLTAPVRWVECVRRLAELHPDTPFIEIGPGTVLAGLCKKIVPRASVTSLGTVAEITTFLEQHA